uniref:DUF255 domain-containing protein n=1 Tax=Panagrolaimus sp. ES5 TaxID=591445 RepID=A0AC34FCY9_9BILA
MAGHSHDGPANRLAQEKSPYLLQHAHNPVDWYPWGEEAFKIAKETNRPVFLSVGYSTCHWCHVMERESFINPEIAKLMNENFVNIKVDREERPDVDRVYMNFITTTQGHGGWPMSVFLTPTGEPLSGGTYFPPEDKWGTPGFKTVLKSLSDQWKKNKDGLIARGQSISYMMRDEATSATGEAPAPKVMLQQCYNHSVRTFDEKYGGFGQGTKFPKPVSLEFLLYYYKKNSKSSSGQSALKMLENTLTAINNGGIHDHLGKGFHRYSVDRQWRIPHYEKMLYDQGQLLTVYSNFYKVTNKFGHVVEDIIEYVKKDLTHKLGGFFSAEDAESYPTQEAKVKGEGSFYLGGFFSAEDAESYPTQEAKLKGEGSFYVWTYDDLKKALTPKQLDAFSSYYGVEKNGNCPPGSDPHNELTNQNTFYVKMLFKCKCISAKNPKPILAFSVDYAFLIQSLIDLYEADFNESHLQWAKQLQTEMNELFFDNNSKSGYFNARQDPTVFTRIKEDQDGAEPCTNSVASLNLLRLSDIFGDEEYKKRAFDIFNGHANELEQYPYALPKMVLAASRAAASAMQIVVVSPENDDQLTQKMLQLIRHQYIPDKCVIYLSAVKTKENEYLLSCNPQLRNQLKIGKEAPAVFICENFTCSIPICDLKELKKRLAATY